jgi:ribosomal protein RSM22 (predicted rRNA methylase)
MFNGVTPHRPGYLAAGRLRRAYVHYYLPVNAEKVARILSELESYAPFPKRLRVLDFGCGPGTASVALLLRRKVTELWQVDVVDEALGDAAFFARALGVEPRQAHEVPPGERFDLILAANVLSETEAPLEEFLTEQGHLVVVEPALKGATRRLMQWRDRLAARGYRIAAPCLRSTPCPMLEREDLWCHMDVAWPRPAGIAEVDRRVGLQKESLKYSYVVVTRGGPTLADLGGTQRVVSNLHKEKGKAWTMLCGRGGPLCRAEVLTRHRSEATAAFFRADRGDVLKMDALGPSARSEGPVEKIGGGGGTVLSPSRAPTEPG